MNITVEDQPCILLETVELLYAFVNEIPAQDLTSDGVYCIPGWKLQQMMDVACAGLDRHQPMLRFFFQSEKLLDKPNQETCIARNLAYNTMELHSKTLEESFLLLKSVWQGIHQKRNFPVSVGTFAINWGERSESEFVPLTEDLNLLAVSEEYQKKLLEAIAGAVQYLELLQKLITPVAQKLEALLVPWQNEAQKLREELRTFFNRADIDQHLQRLWGLSGENRYESVCVALRYLDADSKPGQFDVNNNRVNWHLGIANRLWDAEQASFDDWEYKALRLLGNASRMQMLKEILHTPLTTREIAQRLDLHLGSVCRDMNSLFDAKLILVVMSDGRKRYQTNRDTVDAIIRHLSTLR